MKVKSILELDVQRYIEHHEFRGGNTTDYQCYNCAKSYTGMVVLVSYITEPPQYNS